ncbi:MAG TPA: cytochrome c oxidase accessory protein CcoG [Alphaproteobacteria bacterium]
MPLDMTQGTSGADAPSAGVRSANAPLYADRIKVYPKAVKGTFRRIKWAILAICLGLYYVVPWIRWDRGPGAPDQAVLIDMPGRRAYFFAIEIWPQEVYFLTGLLILAAVALFLVTSLLGRVWCGYACPQTVWTDLFMLVERLIEGDRNARMRLDQQPLSWAKAAKKTAKHAAWLVIAAATGGAWVFYFADAPTALKDIFTGQASVTIYFFVGLFTATTYLLAGWAREQVCTYMCPWPRIQAAMFDENTLIVTYRKWRGEPRGKHKAGQSWDGRGDCIDCQQCVAVCPVGIDIRNGPQMECIGCGLCIDACNAVMDKVGRPRNLIAFATLAGEQARVSGTPSKYRLIRPRTVLYGTLLVLVAATMGAALWLRSTVELSVQRDRAPLFVTLSDGAIRNGYTLKILNKTRADRDYALSVSGVPSAKISVVGAETATGDKLVLSAKADTVATYRVYVTAPAGVLKTESVPLVFALQAHGAREQAQYQSIFMGPAK